MKTFLFSLTLFFVSVSSRCSDLFFQLQDRTPFTIVFNQLTVSYGCRYFQMNNLPQGNYPIEIYNSCMTPGSSCAIPLYNGIVSIPAGFQVMAYLDMYGRLQMGSTIPLSSPSSGYSSISDNNRYYGSMRYFDLNDSTSLQAAKAMLSDISNTRYKVSFLKHCIYYHGIKSQRLSELMLDFPFDSERLDLATFAFPFTIDRENYYIVYESLIFIGSKHQLGHHLYYLRY